MKVLNYLKKTLFFTMLIFFFVTAAIMRINAGQLLYTKNQYNKIYNEKVALELELKSLKRKFKNEKANFESDISKLKSEIDNLNRKIELLEKQMQEESDLSNKKIAELEKRTDILKRTGSEREKELIEENRKLQERCSLDLAKMEDILKKERDKFLEDINDLKKSYQEKLDNLKKEIANCNEELSSLKELNKKQKMELERMEAQANELEDKLADEIKNGDIRLKRFHDKLIINIDDKISFDSGSSMLKKEILNALEKIRDILDKYPENSIIVERHTDDVPIRSRSFRDNWQLSTERALSVLGFLLKNTKLNPERFSAAGYGEYNPIVSNDTAQNRALNRRVDIVVVPRLKKK